MKDKLGDRIKSHQYDWNTTRYKLPKRTYTIIRLDGKAFHTYTKGFDKPFDDKLVNSMDAAAIYLCSKIQGAKFAYVQSDEISILVTDFDKVNSSAWFDGKLLKMASVSASMATTAFNKEMLKQKAQAMDMSKLTLQYLNDYKMAEFDSRVFSIDFINKIFMVKGEEIYLDPREEVANYFHWRQKDCVRNSVTMVALSNFSHKELHGKNTKQMKQMLHDVSDPWEFYPEGLQRGRMIFKEKYEKDGAMRSRWVAKPVIDIKTHREDFMKMIPVKKYFIPVPVKQSWYNRLYEKFKSILK